MKQSEIAFGALRLPLDYAAAVAALALAYRIRPFTDLIPGRQFVFLPEQLPPFSEYLLFSLVAAVGLIVLFAINRLYSLKKSSGLIRESTKIGFLVSVWMLFIIAYYFLVVHQLFFSRITLAHIWLFTILLVSGERILLRGLRALLWRFGIGRRRILFVGVSDLADRLFTEFSKDPRYRVIGALSPRRESRRIRSSRCRRSHLRSFRNPRKARNRSESMQLRASNEGGRLSHLFPVSPRSNAA